MQYNFIKPRTPQYTKGYLIIESDDGNQGDFTAWLPLLERLKYKHTQWSKNKTVVACPNVNSGTIGKSGKMTSAQLKTLQDKYGWEIMSHGKHHVGIGRHPVIANVIAGANEIQIYLPSYIGHDVGADLLLYDFQISDGVNTEIFKVTSITSTGILINKNLVNSYATQNSFVEITDQSLQNLLQGCLNDLIGWGLKAKNHAYTYHSATQHLPNANALSKVGAIFDSARGNWGNSNQLANSQWYNMTAFQLDGTDELSVIDAKLNETFTSGGILIVYAHGQDNAVVKERLTYLIDGAFARGIRIITRSTAVQLFKQ